MYHFCTSEIKFIQLVCFSLLHFFFHFNFSFYNHVWFVRERSIVEERRTEETVYRLSPTQPLTPNSQTGVARWF